MNSEFTYVPARNTNISATFAKARATTRKTLAPVVTALMQQALQTKPQSLGALVKQSDLAKPVVARYLNELHAAKLIHVSAWARDSRGYPTIRLFAWGSLPDAACPTTNRTSTTRMRVLRAARKAGAA